MTNLIAIILAINLFNLNPCDKNIHDLVEKGETKKVRKLIRKCPEKIHSTDHVYSATPLHIAALIGNTTIIKFLIDNGADVNAGDREGSKPIDYASQNIHKPAIEILVDRESEIPSDILWRVVSWCILGFRESEDIYLATTCEGPDKDPETIISITQYYLDHGIDINYHEGFRSAPPILGVVTNKYGVDVVKFFHENGANLNTKDHDGNTLMHYTRGDRKLIDYFTKHGLDIDITDAQGRTPLHHGASNGDTISMKALLDAGANINVREENFCSPPLNLAIFKNKINSVEFLLKNGADVSLCTGQNPVLIVAARQKCISNFNNNITDIIRLLIEYGADINDKNIIGSTSLHYAAECGDIDAALILIKNGIEINARNKKGETALGVALKKEQHKTADLLRKHGGIE
jgi:ankyrin repeat protein